MTTKGNRTVIPGLLEDGTMEPSATHPRSSPLITSGTRQLRGPRALRCATWTATAPWTTAASRRKAKERNPESCQPINHRQRFTILKRQVHEQRKRLFEDCLGACEVRCQAEVTSELPLQASTELRLPAERHALRDAAKAVRVMEHLYAARDVARRQRQYLLSSLLKGRLTSRLYQLRRCVQRIMLDGARCEGEEVVGGVTGRRRGSGDKTPQLVPPSTGVYCNFYPSAVELGVGRHPMSALIDRRTGRLPQRVDIATIRSWLQESAALAIGEQQAAWWVHLAATYEPVGAPPPAQQLFVSTYCSNMLFDGLEDLAFTMLQALSAEQRDLRQRQPLQFKARQRYVVGLQETIKYLRAGRVQCVLLAADMEVREGGPTLGHSSPRQRRFRSVDDAVATIKQLCNPSDGDDALASPLTTTTCITCMSRQRLAYALYAKGSHVGCVGILKAEKSIDVLKALRQCGNALCGNYVRLLQHEHA